MLETQKEKDDAIYVKQELLKKMSYQEQELTKEREVLKSGQSQEEQLRKYYLMDVEIHD